MGEDVLYDYGGVRVAREGKWQKYGLYHTLLTCSSGTFDISFLCCIDPFTPLSASHTAISLRPSIECDEIVVDVKNSHQRYKLAKVLRSVYHDPHDPLWPQPNQALAKVLSEFYVYVDLDQTLISNDLSVSEPGSATYKLSKYDRYHISTPRPGARKTLWRLKRCVKSLRLWTAAQEDHAKFFTKRFFPDVFDELVWERMMFSLTTWWKDIPEICEEKGLYNGHVILVDDLEQTVAHPRNWGNTVQAPAWYGDRDDRFMLQEFIPSVVECAVALHEARSLV